MNKNNGITVLKDEYIVKIETKYKDDELIEKKAYVITEDEAVKLIFKYKKFNLLTFKRFEILNKYYQENKHKY